MRRASEVYSVIGTFWNFGQSLLTSNYDFTSTLTRVFLVLNQFTKNWVLNFKYDIACIGCFCCIRFQICNLSVALVSIMLSDE